MFPRPVSSPVAHGETGYQAAGGAAYQRAGGAALDRAGAVSVGSIFQSSSPATDGQLQASDAAVWITAFVNHGCEASPHGAASCCACCSRSQAVVTAAVDCSSGCR